MPLHHVVLSLLADGPSHGYELKGAFEEAVGPQWGQLNIGHLYQLLDRLSRDGLATSHRESQTVKPDRVVHELTPAGRAELATWLATPAPRSGGYRDEFFLKVVAAARTGDAAVLDEVLSTQRRHLMTEAHHLSALEREHRDDAVVSLLIKNARLHVEADLALVQSAEETLPQTLRKPRTKPATRHTASSATPVQRAARSTG